VVFCLNKESLVLIFGPTVEGGSVRESWGSSKTENLFFAGVTVGDMGAAVEVGGEVGITAGLLVAEVAMRGDTFVERFGAGRGVMGGEVAPT
jgi:hypothetical protein